MTPVTWFLRVARAEGVSLLVLVGVAMPLKYGLGVPEPVAWVGWMHGVLAILYGLTLASAARCAGWGLGRAALALVVSLLPGGTFWLERQVERWPTAP